MWDADACEMVGLIGTHGHQQCDRLLKMDQSTVMPNSYHWWYLLASGDSVWKGEPNPRSGIEHRVDEH
jgi:hypothetical protein